MQQQDQPGQQGPQEQPAQQCIPIKVYRTLDRLMVSAPMAGIEPEDIAVEVTRDAHLLISGELRGTLKDIKEVLLDEWCAGSYFRDVALPDHVNGELANVTYGNGVLVVVLPIDHQTHPIRLTLSDTGQARGERVGSSGHPPRARTDDEHRAAKADQQAAHGGNPLSHG